jgi:glutamine synthetase
MIHEISAHLTQIKTAVDEMVEARKKANAIEDGKKQAQAYCDHVKPYFETIRYNVDKLELLVDDDSWPLPKYREMLFIR